MTNTYKLNDNVSENFEFHLTVDGKDCVYLMRYPSGEENKKMAELAKASDDASSRLKEATDDQAAKDKALKDLEKSATEMTKFFQGLITPQDDAPAVDVAMENQPAPVLRNFQKMLQTELSLEAK